MAKDTRAFSTGVFDSLWNGIVQFIQLLNVVILNIFGFGKAVGGEGQKDKDVQKINNVEGSEEIIPKLKGINEIPGPICLPIVGTLWTSSALAHQSKNLMEANNERMKKYGPIVKECHFWGFPMIMFLDPHHIEIVLKSMGSIRPDIEILSMYRKSRPDIYDAAGLTNEHGPAYERLHTAFSPIFHSPRVVRDMLQGSDEMAQDFVNLIHKNGPEFEIFDVLNKWVAETSFFNIFGKRFGFIEDEASDVNREYFKYHSNIFATFHNSAYSVIWKYFPTKMWSDMVEAEEFMIKAIDDILQSALKNEEEIEPIGAFKEILNAKGVSYADKRLIIIETIGGSTDTVLNQTIFALYYISKNKNVLDKLMEELRECLPSKDSVIDEDVLGRMVYMKACIQEVFRVGTITPTIFRITEKPIEVGGYKIPANVLVVPHFWYASMQDTAFYRATEFLPERWIYNENVPPFSPHKPNLMNPFGIGKQMCIGRRMAKQNITLMTAKIFRNFQVQFNGKIEFTFDWIRRIQNPLSVTLTPLAD